MTCDDQLLPLVVSQLCETRLVLTKCQRESQEEVGPLRVFVIHTLDHKHTT